MLVPTTILAQQHYGTFAERLKDYPFTIEHVSRFRSPAEQKQAIDGLQDAAPSTSSSAPTAILSRDVRAKDLGLIIVDEEQRFGVKQKELLRQLKLRVDVISMSATPIPRTLQMSLAGLRDISVIETPPEGRRPVKTYVGEYDEELVKQALLREHARGGQAFFLHNRVESIDETAERLRGLCPGMRFIVAHGQMEDKILEERMLSFLRGEADVLVSTSIIESGIDIPQANTLDRRPLGRLRPVAALPDPRARRPQPRARVRVPPVSERRGADAGGRAAARRAERLHRARRRLQDRDARPRAARRRQPARRRAVRPRRGARLRALHADARRGGRGGRAGGRRGRGGDGRAGADGRQRRRLRPGRLHPLRAGEDRRAPADRGRRRRRRPRAAARGARRPLRRAARSRCATSSTCSARASSSARPARRT